MRPEDQVEVRYTPEFKRNVKRLTRRYPRIRGDLDPIITELRAGKTPGDRISGIGHAVYKVRCANSSALRGKSGGFRVIYYLRTRSTVILVAVYSKSDQGDVSVRQLREIIAQSGLSE